MRILHFLDTTNHGGAEVLTLDVCRNAKNAGFEMTFVTSNGGTMEDDFRLSGAEFYKFKRKFPIDFSLVSNLRQIIEEKQISIVHAHQPVEALHLYLATRKMKNVGKVLSYHGGTTLDWKNLQAAKFLIPRMDANVIVSESLKKDYSFDTKNFTVIYNGTDAKRLKPSGKSVRDELNLPNNSLLIGMIGNFYRENRKDQLTICRALPKIFAEIPNLQCIFAGKTEAGAEEKKAACVNFCIDNSISESVHFLGVRNDIPDILVELDLFIFSSFHEGLPIAMIEAMLAKVPLIISDIEPLLEASENGKYAEIFPLQNAEILSEKIVQLLKNKQLRDDLANRAFDYANENFSIEAHLKNLKNLYEKILSSKEKLSTD